MFQIVYQITGTSPGAPASTKMEAYELAAAHTSSTGGAWANKFWRRVAVFWAVAGVKDKLSQALSAALHADIS